MRLCDLTLEKKHVIFKYAVNVNTEAESTKSEECPEAPLPELSEKFNLIPRIVCKIMGWPVKYATAMNVYRIALSYTKHGTRSVSFKFEKSIETIGGEMHKMTTPLVRIDAPADGESGKRELTEEEVATIEELIFECERYIGGDRSQQMLNFKEAKAALNATADIGSRDMFSGTEG